MASSQLDVHWFGSHLYVCVNVYVVYMRVCMCVATYGAWKEGTRNWNRRTVCHLSVHPRTPSYEAREAYVHVMRLTLSLCLCARVCTPSIYILTHAAKVEAFSLSGRPLVSFIKCAVKDVLRRRAGLSLQSEQLQSEEIL